MNESLAFAYEVLKDTAVCGFEAQGVLEIQAWKVRCYYPSACFQDIPRHLGQELLSSGGGLISNIWLYLGTSAPYS